MDYNQIEELVSALESLGLKNQVIPEINNDWNKQGDIDFTGEAHDKFCQDSELLMSVMKVFLEYRKKYNRIFVRFSVYLPEEE
ncbi:MAG: hypothetical protein H0X31_02810 [Nostocaceae cyanobacterium]|nr:hypothetical protein [Nostocaceae cyanobacterium]